MHKTWFYDHHIKHRTIPNSLSPCRADFSSQSQWNAYYAQIWEAHQEECSECAELDGPPGGGRHPLSGRIMAPYFPVLPVQLLHAARLEENDA